MNDKDLKNQKVIKIIFPDLEEMPEDIYANNIRVTHQSDDVVIYFAKVDSPPLLKEETYEKEAIRAKVVARIRLSSTILPGFIKALENKSESLEKKSEDQNVGSSN